MKLTDTGPLVSIIVPVYNVEDRLDRCIRSLVDQTYQNIQLILVNDGSKDRSGTICDEWASKDSRIIVIHQANAGVSCARNAGLDAAQGQYAAFVDSDDYVDSDMYGTMIREAAEQESDQVCCYLCNIYPNREQPEKHAFGHQTLRGDQVYSELILSMVTPDQFDKKARLLQSPCNKLYRYAIIEQNHIRFDTKLPYAEDWLFNLNYYRFSRCVSFIPDCLYYYDRTTVGSLSKKVRWDGFEHSFRLRSREREWFPELHTEESFRDLVLKIQSHYLNQYAWLRGYAGFRKYAAHLYRNPDLRKIYIAADTVPLKYRLPHFCFRSGSSQEWLFCCWAAAHVTVSALKYYVKKIIGK